LLSLTALCSAFYLLPVLPAKPSTMQTQYTRITAYKLVLNLLSSTAECMICRCSVTGHATEKVNRLTQHTTSMVDNTRSLCGKCHMKNTR